MLKPIDLVKTRLQVPNSPYTSLFGGMSQIFREEGLATLYTGLSSELLKSSVQSFRSPSPPTHARMFATCSSRPLAHLLIMCFVLLFVWLR